MSLNSLNMFDITHKVFQIAARIFWKNKGIKTGP